MSLIFLVSSGTRKYFVCDRGTREKMLKSTALEQGFSKVSAGVPPYVI
jgi:hypothetical protein